MSRTTDGMQVDHTPPQLVDIGTRNRSRYQQRDDVLDLVWDFLDPESGIAEYRCIIYQLHQVSCLKALSSVQAGIFTD